MNSEPAINLTQNVEPEEGAFGRPHAAQSKPVSVWLAQAFLVVIFLTGVALPFVNGWRGFNIGFAIFPPLVLGLWLGLQKRKTWARWGLVAIFCYGIVNSVSALVRSGGVDDGSAALHVATDRTGVVVGTLLLELALGAIAVRLALGRAEKRYFTAPIHSKLQVLS